MPKRYDPELRARAVRLVLEHRDQYESMTAAVEAVAAQQGVARETLRRWVNKAQIDAGTRVGVSSSDEDTIKGLQDEVKRLRADNEILKAAATFFAGELDPRKR